MCLKYNFVAEFQWQHVVRTLATRLEELPQIVGPLEGTIWHSSSLTGPGRLLAKLAIILPNKFQTKHSYYLLLYLRKKFTFTRWPFKPSTSTCTTYCNILKLCILPTVCLCGSYGPHGKARLFPWTILIDWSLQRRRELWTEILYTYLEEIQSLHE
jgi:hypothetical protein